MTKSTSNKSEITSKKPLLPLVPEDDDPLTKSNSTVFELMTNPTSANSSKYKITVRVLQGGESVRSVIDWAFSVSKVLIGLNATNFESRHRLVQTMIKGNASAMYLAHITALAMTAKAAARSNAADDAAKALVDAQALTDRSE